jgi:hypothetical protein
MPMDRRPAASNQTFAPPRRTRLKMATSRDGAWLVRVAFPALMMYATKHAMIDAPTIAPQQTSCRLDQSGVL